MPLYEFVCDYPKCAYKSRLIEILTKSDEDYLCPGCNKKLGRILSPSRGFVIGTDNPCRND